MVVAGSGRYGDSGEIKITDRVGYLDQQLADLFQISVQKWVACKKKLVETDRVEVSENNVIRIKNWGKYQSEYERQKPYRERESTIESSQNGCNQKLQDKVTDTLVTKSTTGDRDRDYRLEKENRDRETPLNPPTVCPSLESIINAYQDNILLGGTVSEEMENELTGACRRYTPAWVADAMKEALFANQPTWRYIIGILQNWSKEGKR